MTETAREMRSGVAQAYVVSDNNRQIPQPLETKRHFHTALLDFDSPLGRIDLCRFPQEKVPFHFVPVLLYVHRNRRLIRDRSPGRPHLAGAGFQARSKALEILEEGGGAGPSTMPRRDHE